MGDDVGWAGWREKRRSKSDGLRRTLRRQDGITQVKRSNLRCRGADGGESARLPSHSPHLATSIAGIAGAATMLPSHSRLPPSLAAPGQGSGCGQASPQARRRRAAAT